MTPPNEGRGVYEADDVMFDEAGFWTAEITVDVQGMGTQTAEATIPVLGDPQIPAPGDRAEPTENLTLDSTGVPEGAIDSRAAATGEIPDPELHEWTIARAIEEGRPALVLFATPVYCESKFCGPVTDMIQELAGRHDDRAVFIHVEIWKEFGETDGGERGGVRMAPAAGRRLHRALALPDRRRRHHPGPVELHVERGAGRGRAPGAPADGSELTAAYRTPREP